MRRVIAVLILLFTPPLFADEAPSSVPQAFELELRPYAGYSNYSGITLGSDFFFRLPMDDHWQWQAGAGLIADKRDVSHMFSTGFVYNFSVERDRSFFVGAGLGVGNYFRFMESNRVIKDKIYGYVEVGKRFALNKAGTITWNPSATAFSNASSNAVITINPVNFAWSF